MSTIMKLSSLAHFLLGHYLTVSVLSNLICLALKPKQNKQERFNWPFLITIIYRKAGGRSHKTILE